ncbi:MAG TPA: histidine phosphatase family protein [Methanocella sp.]|nr:histidine phosphatase family protein [Methanocella sp.]
MKFISPETSYALIIRHAERPNLSVLNFRRNTNLTEKGRDDALKLGKWLHGQQLTGIYSSPVLRCVQTCREIIEGAGLNHPGITTRVTLGEPGSYIINPLLVYPYFIISDVPGVIRKFISRGKMSGFCTLREGSINIVNEIAADISREKVKNLYVTHDAVLAPFISFFTGEKFADDRWINYLDGIIITMNGPELRLIWDGKEYPIDRKFYG